MQEIFNGVDRNETVVFYLRLFTSFLSEGVRLERMSV